MSNTEPEDRDSKETAQAETPQEMSTNFDPEAMRALAKQMLQDGTMPSEEKLAAALERIREKHAAKILKAREQDQRENS